LNNKFLLPGPRHGWIYLRAIP